MRPDAGRPGLAAHGPDLPRVRVRVACEGPELESPRGIVELEPLFACNLKCEGCGKIQHPASVLRRHLTPEECFRAVDECGAPMVSLPGGEPRERTPERD